MTPHKRQKKKDHKSSSDDQLESTDSKGSIILVDSIVVARANIRDRSQG